MKLSDNVYIEHMVSVCIIRRSSWIICLSTIVACDVNINDFILRSYRLRTKNFTNTEMY